MAILDRITLKNIFKPGAKPTAAVFANWMDSFWHKNDPINLNQVKGLTEELNNKISTEDKTQILTALKTQEDTWNELKDQTVTKYNDQYQSVAADILQRIDAETRAVITYKKMNSDPIIASNIYKEFSGSYYIDSAVLDNDGISIRRFGCKCDGVTDDTTAFNSALLYAKSVGNVTLIIPNGVCRISSLIIDKTSGLTIKGKGKIMKFGQSKENIFYIANSSRVTFRDFYIDGEGWNASMDNGYQGCGVLTSKCNTLDFQNMTINNMPGGGIITTDSNDVSVSDCKFYGNKTLADIAFGYATPIAPLVGFKCINNLCMSTNYFGILVQGYGHDVYIAGNTVKNKTIYGINVYRRDLDQTLIWKNVIIDGNTVENISDSIDQRNPSAGTFYGMGIFLQTVHQVTVSNNIVKNTLIGRSESPVSRTLTPGAIAVGDCTCYKIVNNTIENSDIDGISISASVYFDEECSFVAGNTIKNCSVYGIYNINSPNVIISTNSVFDAKNASIFILKSTAGDLNGVSVINNRIFSKATTGIGFYSDSGLLNNCDITGNKINDAGLYAISVVSGQNIVVSGNQIINDNIAPGAAYHAIIMQKCTGSDVKGNNISGLKKYTKSIYLNHVVKGFIRENYVPVAPEIETNCQGLVISDNII